MEFSADEVAKWMLKEFYGILYQSRAISYITSNFGESFTYVNDVAIQSKTNDAWSPHLRVT